MAISNVTTVQRVEVYPLADSSAAATANAKHPTVMVVYNHTLAGTGGDAGVDGSVSTTVKHINKFVEDGGAATSVSGEDALVQTVCGAVWA
jgi:hypothetical protein